MGLFSGLGQAIGGLVDPMGQATTENANAGITQNLAPGSPFWQSGQITGDQGILQGAAALQNAPVSVNTGNVDADAAQFGNLAGTYGNIASHGGQLTQAVLNQQRADLANTNFVGLKGASQKSAGAVLAQNNAERNWAATGQTQSRAQVLANMLQKQTWNTAVSHANFEAALAGRGLQYSDENLARGLGMTLSEAANAAGNKQTSLGLDMGAINNALGTRTFQGIAGAVSSAGSTLADLGGADASDGNAGTTNSTGLTQGTQTYDNGYAMPQTALGTSHNTATNFEPVGDYYNVDTTNAATQSAYVNPVTGSTVNGNIPSTTASWGDWLTDGSSLVS